MKTFIRIIQILTAVLFIISGLVKANDPLGLSYKMQEFFELWSSSLSASHLLFRNHFIDLLDFLHRHSLGLSVFMITLEVVTGIALLLVWKRNFFLYLLLLLIIFFSFLTGYAYLSGKFTNCGCFGDCLPITPLTSFTKDIILLVMIVILITGKKYLVPVISPLRSIIFIATSLVIVVGIQIYVLNYLPVADCLPFKKGNNITEQMKPPPNSVPDSFAIKFVYEKQGRRFEFAPDNLPADFTTYKFIDRKQELIRKGNADPAIKSFSLTGVSGEDSTSVILEQPKVVLLFLLSYENESGWIKSFKKLAVDASQQKIPVFIVTSDPVGLKGKLAAAGINENVFTCDFTAIRTAARTTPTLYILKHGTVYNKYSYHELNKADNDLNK